MGSKVRGTIDEKLARGTDTSRGPAHCWPWTGIVGQWGLPQLSHRNVSYSCRRLVWNRTYGGELTKNRIVGINCGERRCLNPRHLILKPQNDIQPRFWSKVLKTDGCWIWNGHVNPNGYGYFAPTATTMRRAHRVAWEITFGVTLSPDQVLMHSCDNPRCVKPAHLSVGTQRDNYEDMIAKGRHPVICAARARHAPDTSSTDGAKEIK